MNKSKREHRMTYYGVVQDETIAFWKSYLSHFVKGDEAFTNAVFNALRDFAERIAFQAVKNERNE